MKVSWVFAASNNHVIGKDNKIPWRLLDDMRLFREITSGHHIVMGRKTFESIGKPLPNRTNIVLSRDTTLKIDGVHVFNNIDDVVRFASERGESELMVIGGAEIYNLTSNIVDKVYYTRVEAEIDGDVKFDFSPDPNIWRLVGEPKIRFKDDRNDHSFTHLVFERV
jgi:dihydrofolate reductase